MAKTFAHGRLEDDLDKPLITEFKIIWSCLFAVTGVESELCEDYCCSPYFLTNTMPSSEFKKK